MTVKVISKTLEEGSEFYFGQVLTVTNGFSKEPDTVSITTVKMLPELFEIIHQKNKFTMKNFKVLHPVGGDLNTLLKRGQYEYEHICSIDCSSLEEAFKLSQNDFSERYMSLNKRSTSVGDIIIDTEEWKHYFVAPVGFVEIPSTVSQYIDWGNHPKAKGVRHR